MADDELAEATGRSDQRRRLAAQRAADAKRRAGAARKHAEKARNRGNERAAAIHEHEAVIHQRAVEIHLEAARLQDQHAKELTDVSERKGIDESSLRQVMANVRRAREEAELRSEEARTYALRARERAEQLHGRGNERDA